MRGQSVDLRIADVVIAGQRRPLGDVAGLVASIRDLGLINPILVGPGRRLIAGLHRLEACRSLGWKTIPAVVVDLDRLHAEMAEIDENLIRNELTVLEHGEQLARRKEIYEAIHPETKTGGNPGKAGGGKKAKSEMISSFAEDTAVKTHVSPRTVQQEVQIANSLPVAVKDSIRNTPLANNKTGLLQLARTPDEDKEAVASLASSGTMTVPQARGEVARRKKRTSLKARAAASSPNGKTSWDVREGDCIAVMGSLDAGIARLVFADPPYNIGVDYGDGKAADRRPDGEFLAWTESWVRAAARLLAADGSMWVLINDEYADHVGIILRHAGLHRRNWIKWYETFGVNTQERFNRTSRHLFYCVKDPKKFVFNRESVCRPSDRQAKHNDRRADPGGKVWDDVWGVNPAIPRLVQNSRERLPDVPTQLPLALLRPIVGCASEPGDLVIDPFAGSGTAGHAALESGRRFLGIDRSGPYVTLARMRLQSVKGQNHGDEA